MTKIKLNEGDKVRFMTRAQYEKYSTRVAIDDYSVYKCVTLSDEFFTKEHTILHLLDDVSFFVDFDGAAKAFVFPLYIVTHINGKPNPLFNIPNLYKEQCDNENI